MGKAAWSFLGYCTAGTRSTALPRFPPSAIPQSEDTAELRAKFAHLFDKSNNHDVEVEVGDFSFFGEGIPHFGKMQNKARYAIFIMVIGQCAASRAHRRTGGRASERVRAPKP
jgi:hypothetical protein